MSHQLIAGGSVARLHSRQPHDALYTAHDAAALRILETATAAAVSEPAGAAAAFTLLDAMLYLYNRTRYNLQSTIGSNQHAER